MMTSGGEPASTHTSLTGATSLTVTWQLNDERRPKIVVRRNVTVSNYIHPTTFIPAETQDHQSTQRPTMTPRPATTARPTTTPHEGAPTPTTHHLHRLTTRERCPAPTRAPNAHQQHPAPSNDTQRPQTTPRDHDDPPPHHPQLTIPLGRQRPTHG